MNVMGKIVTVFGSALPLENDVEYQLAYNLGKRLAQNGFTVCNGGFDGTMEASARGAKEAGGSTIGVTAHFYGRSANEWIDKEIRVPTLVDRLLKLIEIGDAYVVLKGGTGTLLELAAVWEFMNKGTISQKPFVLVGNFWYSVAKTVDEDLGIDTRGSFSRYMTFTDTPEECVNILTKRLL